VSPDAVSSDDENSDDGNSNPGASDMPSGSALVSSQDDDSGPAANRGRPVPRARRWVTRILGALVAAGLLTVAALNVPWRDQLILRPSLGAPGQTFVGQILGDWKALGGSVRYRFDAGQKPDQDSPLKGSELASAVRLGGELDVTSERLAGRPWRPGRRQGTNARTCCSAARPARGRHRRRAA